MVVRFSNENGCLVAMVENGDVREHFDGMNYFPVMIEIGNLKVRYEDDYERYNQLHDEHFTEEEDEEIYDVFKDEH